MPVQYNNKSFCNEKKKTIKVTKNEHNEIIFPKPRYKPFFPPFLSFGIDDIRRSKESLLIHTKPYFGYNAQKIDTNAVKPAKQYQPIRSTTLPPSTTSTNAPFTTTTIRYYTPERYFQSTTASTTTTTTTTAQPYLSTRLTAQPKSLANSKCFVFSHICEN